MALRLALTTEHGIVLPEAYANVGGIAINKSFLDVEGEPRTTQYTLQFELFIYADEAGYRDGRRPVSVVPLACVHDVAVPAMAAAYAHVVSLDGFAEAIEA